jgi:hypothetical protein
MSDAITEAATPTRTATTAAVEARHGTAEMSDGSFFPTSVDFFGRFS